MSEVISNLQGKQWLTQLLQKLLVRYEQLDQQIQELVKKMEVAEEQYEKDLASFSVLTDSNFRTTSGELKVDVVQNSINVSEKIVENGQACLAMREVHNKLMSEFQQVEAQIAMTRQFLEQNFDDLPEIPQEDSEPKKHRLIDEAFCALMELNDFSTLADIREVLHNWGLTHWTPEKLAKTLDNQYHRISERLLSKTIKEGKNFWRLSDQGWSYYQRNLRDLHRKLLDEQ